MNSEAELFGIVSTCIVLEEEHAVGSIQRADYEREWKSLVIAFCTFRDSFWGPNPSKAIMEAWWRKTCMESLGKEMYNSTVYLNLFQNGAVDFKEQEMKTYGMLAQYIYQLQDNMAQLKIEQDAETRSAIHATLGSIIATSQKCATVLSAKVKEKLVFAEKYYNRLHATMGPLLESEMDELTQHVYCIDREWQNASMP
jgi:hypothetical protein